MTEPPVLRVHLDPGVFVEAVRFTSAHTLFDSRLVEKDYFCTLILSGLSTVDSLVFKGGTCLAKVHAGFYRLSEDLDFTISIAGAATRGRRRASVAPVKQALDGLPSREPSLRVTEPLVGANNSTQYLATLAYTSVLTGREETVKVEVGLREPLLVAATTRDAATILLDPFTEEPSVAPVPVRCIALIEAFAEKLRAALSRREPAIRDFFDIDWATSRGILDTGEPELLALVASKLQVPGNAPVDVSAARFAALRRQVELRLRPVLRPNDLLAFDLDRAFGMVHEVASTLGRS